METLPSFPDPTGGSACKECVRSEPNEANQMEKVQYRLTAPVYKGIHTRTITSTHGKCHHGIRVTSWLFRIVCCIELVRILCNLVMYRTSFE